MAGFTQFMDPSKFSAIVTDNWKIRRRWMKYSIFWLAGNVEFLICWTIYSGGSAIGVQIVMTLMTALLGIVGFYIFGATYDDHSKRRYGIPVVSGEDCPPVPGDEPEPKPEDE